MVKNVLHEKAKAFFSYHPTPWKDTFVPPFDYVVMITEVRGLIYNMISKLINRKKNRELNQSPRKLTTCPIQAC